MKKRWLSYLIASALALVIAFVGVSLEAENKGTDPVLWMQYLSDGFFLSAVLFLGGGALTFIAEAGNFYGLQFLGHELVRLFSFRKERFEDKKDYFTYCTEKQAKQKEKGKSAVIKVMLHVGLGCLALSLIFTFAFYQI
ncbi:MAG: DUF3899 domain-containing protein [Eubacteriales bacterium]